MFALLVWPRRSQESSVEVGTDNGISVDPDQKNMPEYLAPPASVAETLEKRIEASIIEIYRMARVEYDRASGTRSSAQSKEQNFEQTNLAIADFAASLAQADRDTLILVGRGLGIGEAELQALECVPHESYDTGALNDEIDAVTATLTQAIGVTAKAELLKRLTMRMLPGLSAETRKRIEGEIDEAAQQAEQEGAAMREAELAAMSGNQSEEDEEDNAPGEGDEE